MQQAGAALPEGWFQMTDPNSGNAFYHNPSTNQTTWTLPQDAAAAPAQQAAAAGAGGGYGKAAAEEGAGNRFDPYGSSGSTQVGANGLGAAGGVDPSMGQGLGAFASGGGGGDAAALMQQAMMGGSGMGGGMGAMPGMAGMPGMGVMGGMGMGGGMCGGMGGGMASGMGGCMGAGMGGGMAGGGGDGVMVSGTVKAWREDKGFGFITPADGGEDIFVHRVNLSDGGMLIQGSTVQYQAQWNAQKNKFQAGNVMGAVPQAGKGGEPGTQGGAGKGPSPGAEKGPMQNGTVKAWFEEKGFGFVIPSDGGEDVFVHRTSLQDGMSLTQGAQVQYQVEWNQQKNKFQAATCYGASPEGGGGGKGAVGDAGKQLGSTGEPIDNLFIAGLPINSTEHTVSALFGAYGQVIDCKVLPASGKPDVAALVRMGSVQQAQWMVENMNGNIPAGTSNPLIVRYADKRGKGEKGKGKGGMDMGGMGGMSGMMLPGLQDMPQGMPQMQQMQQGMPQGQMPQGQMPQGGMQQPGGFMSW